MIFWFDPGQLLFSRILFLKILFGNDGLQAMNRCFCLLTFLALEDGNWQ